MQERVLLRDGQPILLTPKTMEMLLILVENHGHVVRKDTLMQRIWPDTFVQEDNITYNISVLRKTLACGTSGERYIETVPKSGYRFVASVRTLHSGDGAEAPATNPPEAAFPGTIDAAKQLHPKIPPKQTGGYPELRDASRADRRNWRTWASLTLAGSLALTSMALVFRIRQQNAHALTSQDTVVLADFTNDTGDAVFDDTLKQALSISLQQSPFLNLLSEEKVSGTLKLMAKPPDTKLTPEVARELCQRAGSKAYLSGSIASLGNQYVLGLKAVNCQTGDFLAEEQERATERTGACGHGPRRPRNCARSWANRSARCRSSIRRSSRPPRPRSKPFRPTAWDENQDGKGDDAGAVPFFQRAIQLDPNFAMAYAVARDELFESRGNQPGGGEHAQGLRTARAGERTGEVLHRVALLRLCHRRPGKGAPGL